MNQIPVYRQSLAYAKARGELPQYRESSVANTACRLEIERAIAAHFDGMHLGQQAVDSVLAAYGAERTAFVLANTVQHLSWDGRFSPASKAWAASIPIPPDVVADTDRRQQYVIRSHPAVLDGYIGLVRKALHEKERPSVHAELNRPPVSARPHPCHPAEMGR